MLELETFGGVLLLLLVALVLSMFRVLREYERGVIFMLAVCRTHVRQTRFKVVVMVQGL